MFKLKEFYQYKKTLGTYNKVFSNRLLPKFFSIPQKDLKTPPFSKLLSVGSLSQGVVHFKLSQNNTIVTLTNLKGKVICSRSCGSLGYKGKKKRSTKLAIESTIYSILEKIKELNWKQVFVFLNGFAKSRFYLLNCFKNAEIKISLITDTTPIPHNGCRPKKLRRG